MAVSLKSLGIQDLALDERLALIEELWDGISAEGHEVPLTDQQRTELDRRLAAHEADPNDVTSWADVDASIDARLGR